MNNDQLSSSSYNITATVSADDSIVTCVSLCIICSMTGYPTQKALMCIACEMLNSAWGKLKSKTRCRTCMCDRRKILGRFWFNLLLKQQIVLIIILYIYTENRYVCYEQPHMQWIRNCIHRKRATHVFKRIRQNIVRLYDIIVV